MFLMIDNYDSFTYNLVQYFELLGEDMDIFRNDEPITGINFNKYTGIVLSPGPSHPKNSGITLNIIKDYSNVPMLGVCLGMQAMVYQNGGRIIQAISIMHGKTDRISHNGEGLFRNIPSGFNAVRYHSLVADSGSFPSFFTVTGKSTDGDIMAIEHKKLPLFGVQFHPESHLTEHGFTLIENFIGGAYEYQRIHQGTAGRTNT